MNRNGLIPTVLLVAFCISGCGSQVTPFPTVVETLSVGGTAQPSIISSPTVTSTLEPPLRPTLAFLPSPTPWPMDVLGPIAYITEDEISNDAIWLVNPHTQERQRVYGNTTNNSSIAHSLSWSPDARSIAFVKSFGGTSPYTDIFILNMADGETRNLTNTSDLSELEPAWSPDGKKIAYVVNAWLDNTHSLRNIFVMDADGSNIHQLTNCTVSCSQPGWSPSGEFITYMSAFHIFVMNLDGSNPRQVTSGGENMSPVWSPDGQKIAFIRSVDLLAQGYLYLVKPDGTGLTALTDSYNKVWANIAWSPDGRFIAFQNDPQNNPDYQSDGIYITDIQTGAVKFITGSPAFAPVWYPLLISTVDPQDVKSMPDCTAGWTRLEAGKQARVMGSAGDPSNRVRSSPVKGNNIIGEIQPGAILQVLEGPVCADGLVFWKVQNMGIPGGYGWTAEGDGKEYWLMPHMRYEP